MRLKIIGDVMLGRFVREKYERCSYDLIRDDVKSYLTNGHVIANLESPVISCDSDDSLRFAGSAELLNHFTWVDCFSLSNNHINDFGTKGMTETLAALSKAGITTNGLYEKSYYPFIIEQDGEKVAVITCADMMNYEFQDECPYKTLRVNRPEEILDCIKYYKEKKYYVILYAHVGMLFTRYPNPVIRDFAHQMIDGGADSVITAHPHCLGGAELYKDKLVVYSLGDFLMDGSSYRRREACILSITIGNGEMKDWAIIPVYTDEDLTVQLAEGPKKDKMLRSFEDVSRNLQAHDKDYMVFYKKQYKKELLTHSMSTLSFEYHKRGLVGLLKTLLKRISAVGSMAKRVVTDRSKMSYDSDAISENNISMKNIR